MNGMEPRASCQLASSSGSNENQVMEMLTLDSPGKELDAQASQTQPMCSDINASQEFAGGIMKITPSDVDVSGTVSYQVIFLLSSLYS